MPGQERRDIKLILEEKTIDNFKIIEELREEIIKLKAKINDLEISVNKKDTMYNQLKNNFDELKNNYELTVKQFNTDITNLKSKLLEIPGSIPTQQIDLKSKSV